MLALKLPDQPALPLIPNAADKFTARGLQAELAFERDAQGKVTGLVIRQADQEIKAVRVNTQASN